MQQQVMLPLEHSGNPLWMIRRDIKRRDTKFHNSVATAMESAYEAGELLIELKERSAYGTFAGELQQLDISDRQAQKYMQFRRLVPVGKLGQYTSINEALTDNRAPKLPPPKPSKQTGPDRTPPREQTTFLDGTSVPYSPGDDLPIFHSDYRSAPVKGATERAHISAAVASVEVQWEAVYESLRRLELNPKTAEAANQIWSEIAQHAESWAQRSEDAE